MLKIRIPSKHVDVGSGLQVGSVEPLSLVRLGLQTVSPLNCGLSLERKRYR